MKKHIFAGAILALLTGCVAPFAYSPNHSQADLPTSRDPIVVELAKEGEMMSGNDFQEPPERDAAYLEHIASFSKIIADTTKQKLKEAGYKIAEPGAKNVFIVKPRYYYLPFTGILPGHINVFLKLYGKDGTQISNAVFGEDITIFSIVGNGSIDDTIKYATERAAQPLVAALKSK